MHLASYVYALRSIFNSAYLRTYTIILSMARQRSSHLITGKSNTMQHVKIDRSSYSSKENNNEETVYHCVYMVC